MHQGGLTASVSDIKGHHVWLNKMQTALNETLVLYPATWDENGVPILSAQL